MNDDERRIRSRGRAIALLCNEWLTIDLLAARCRVSTRTIDTWLHYMRREFIMDRREADRADEDAPGPPPTEFRIVRRREASLRRFAQPMEMRP